MKYNLVGANVVVVAKNHNPAIPSKEWLAQKGVIKGQPVRSINTPVFSACETKEISLHVDENRLQIALSSPSATSLRDLSDAISSYVTALPETPYIAAGINLMWRVITGEGQQDVRRSFAEALGAPFDFLEENIGTQEILYGVNLRFTRDGVVLSMRLVPHQVEKQAEITFNFHKELELEDKPRQIEELVGQIEAHHGYAMELLGKLFGNGAD